MQENVLPDNENDESAFDDDSAVPVKEVVACMVSGEFMGGAETLAAEEMDSGFSVPVDGGRGKRLKKKSKRLEYYTHHFWEH